MYVISAWRKMCSASKTKITSYWHLKKFENLNEKTAVCKPNRVDDRKLVGSMPVLGIIRRFVLGKDT